MPQVFVKLADPTHRLPIPGQRGNFFPADGRTVETSDPYWLDCINDGSLVVTSPPASPAPGQQTLTPLIPST